MIKTVVKIQKSKNITLPMWVIRQLRIVPGDFLRLKETQQGVLIKKQ